MHNNLFCDLADVYEAMVDWPKRLAHEGPFYRRLFKDIGVQRVLDVACGTGHHAAMFHGWGLQVEGADLSPGMIARARENHGEPDGLRWVVRSFDQPAATPAACDAVVCVGNSLALAPDKETIRRAVTEMLAAIRDGGVVVLHLMNLWRLPDGPCVWQKCQRIRLTRGELLIVKGVHRCGSRGFVDLIVTDAGDAPALQHESAELVGVEAEELAAITRTAGANPVAFHGGYHGESYERETSIDLIAVLRK